MFVLPIELLSVEAGVSPIQVLGVVVATGAVCVANVDPGLGRASTALLRRAAASRAAHHSLASVVLSAISDVGKRVVLQELTVPTAIRVPIPSGGVSIVLLTLALREGDSTVVTVPRLAAAGLVVTLGEHVTSLAFATLPASVASPIIDRPS